MVILKNMDINSHRYIHLSNRDSFDIYPGNTSDDFKVKLSPELSFDNLSKWEVGISELSFTPKAEFTNLCICASICVPSNVGQNQLPILRHVSTLNTPEKHVFIYTTPHYIQLSKKFLDEIRIYITDREGNRTSFTDFETFVTLHIRKKELNNGH